MDKWAWKNTRARRSFGTFGGLCLIQKDSRILSRISVTIVPPVTIQEHLEDLEDDLEDLENKHQEPCAKALVSPFEFPIQEDDIADDC
jgi:hypothetical protein